MGQVKALAVGSVNQRCLRCIYSLMNPVITVHSVHSNLVKIHSTCCKLSGMLYYKKYLSYCTVVPKIKRMGKTVKK